MVESPFDAVTGMDPILAASVGVIGGIVFRFVNPTYTIPGANVQASSTVGTAITVVLIANGSLGGTLIAQL